MKTPVIIGALASLVLASTAGAEAPPLPDPEFEVVATLEQGPGNIAMTPEGRIFISQHQFYEPEYRVVELLPDDSTTPWPTDAWSRTPGDDGIGLNAVLGLRSNPRGVVWLLDNGGDVPKVAAWCSVTDQLDRVIHIPPRATRPGSLHNDLAVEIVNDALYIADVGGDNGPEIVVVDLKTGQSRRVLEGHPSVQAEDIEMIVEGRPVQIGEGDGTLAKVGLNPITIDPTYTWVYFVPCELFSIR